MLSIRFLLALVKPFDDMPGVDLGTDEMRFVPFFGTSTKPSPFVRYCMRVWDVPVGCLCRNHLLAEHRELHAIWNIIIHNKRGYSSHPEVLRWKGKLGALWMRHEDEVHEILSRGYNHHSPLYKREIPGAHSGREQDVLLESLNSQKRRLQGKGCSCAVRS